MDKTNNHDGGAVLHRGEPLDRATAAMILVHGRGATAASILSLVDDINESGFTYLAPQARGNTWYPNTFMHPRDVNEPWLGSALDALLRLDATLAEANIPPERIMLLGFSQGACLALEYAARFPRRFGGVVALSGGLIGADGELNGYQGDLDGSVIFLGCSDRDPHIPKERVSVSAETMRALGGEVILRFYPNIGHTVVEDEIQVIRSMMSSVRGQG